MEANGAPVALYSDVDFEGTCVTLEPRPAGFTAPIVWRTLDWTPLGAERASSIALNHRCSQDLQLCEHAVAEAPYLGGFAPLLGYGDGWGDIQWNFPVGVLGHDTVSSIRIEAPSS